MYLFLALATAHFQSNQETHSKFDSPPQACKIDSENVRQLNVNQFGLP